MSTREGDRLSTVEDDDIENASVRISAAAHESRLAYEKVLGLHEDYARSLKAVLENSLQDAKLVAHSITYRAKDPASFEKKAARVSSANPSEPKYSDPLNQITDQAGVRIITYFLSTVEAVDGIMGEQFKVVEKLEKSGAGPDQLGYQSVHYLVQLRSERLALPEYRRFAGLIAEVQVRTILQHAWAEIEHDMQYKAVAALPTKVQRRFAALAGLIEIADREFQAIEEEEASLRQEARKNVDIGNLDDVEVTDDSLKAYLDRRYGPDGRMREWSYGWTASLLRNMGFRTLADIEQCVADYNDDQVSRAAEGGRMGQLTRFEDVVLAAMGPAFALAHPFAHTGDSWFIESATRRLRNMRDAGIPIGNYRPPGYPDSEWKAQEMELFNVRLETPTN